MDPSDLTRKIRAALAARSLGSWPTPLDPAPQLGERSGLEALWIKREDASSTLYGGSKVRGLEFLLADPRPATVYVTVGGTGSTHCLATAVHTAALSQRTVLAQFPQPPTDVTRLIAAACERAATRVVRTRWRGALPVAVGRAWLTARRLGPARWIAGGGAHPRGVVGHFLAGLELASQLPGPPDGIVVPLGSGGTTAGLALAIATLRWPTRVIAVRVAPVVVANRWRVRLLARQAVRLMAPLGVTFQQSSLPLVMVNGIGAGYGHPSAGGEAARALAGAHGLVLDPTYGAKAFAALGAAKLGFRRVVFWHTFAVPPHTPERPT